MSLAVLTRDVALRFVGFDGRATEGALVLRAVGERSSRPETVGDRLNDPTISFVPIRVDDRITLVHLAWIAFVACAEEPPDVAARREIGAASARVELDLVHGETLVGELLYVLPPGHSRVSDLLNSPSERFLLLLGDGETLFVHCAAILRARTE